MAIYNIFESEQEEFPNFEASFPKTEEVKESLFSSFAARLFFFLLLAADVIWAAYATVLLVVAAMFNMVTFGRRQSLVDLQAKAWLRFKRSLICAVALWVAIFSPALGVMFACTYFLMYDRAGIEEIVPTVLRSQFQEFFENA